MHRGPKCIGISIASAGTSIESSSKNLKVDKILSIYL